jgi:hypothetical protein
MTEMKYRLTDDGEIEQVTDMDAFEAINRLAIETQLSADQVIGRIREAVKNENDEKAACEMFEQVVIGKIEAAINDITGQIKSEHQSILEAPEIELLLNRLWNAEKLGIRWEVKNGTEKVLVTEKRSNVVERPFLKVFKRRQVVERMEEVWRDRPISENVKKYDPAPAPKTDYARVLDSRSKANHVVKWHDRIETGDIEVNRVIQQSDFIRALYKASAEVQAMVLDELIKKAIETVEYNLDRSDSKSRSDEDFWDRDYDSVLSMNEKIKLGVKYSKKKGNKIYLRHCPARTSFWYQDNYESLSELIVGLVELIKKEGGDVSDLEG